MSPTCVYYTPAVIAASMQYVLVLRTVVSRHVCHAVYIRIPHTIISPLSPSLLPHTPPHGHMMQLLDQVSRQSEDEDYTDACEHFNRSKNRYADRLPCELTPDKYVCDVVHMYMYLYVYYRQYVSCSSEANRGGWIRVHQCQLH